MVPLLDAIHRRSDRWELRATNPAPHTLYTRVSGRTDLAAVQLLMQAFDRVATAQGVVDAFHDWEQVESYTPEARETYVKWSSGHRSQVSSVHLLIRSRLIAMAISVGNLAVGGFLQSYTDRKVFEQALQATIARRRWERD
jgi:hypothetical protein